MTTFKKDHGPKMGCQEENAFNEALISNPCKNEGPEFKRVKGPLDEGAFDATFDESPY